MFTGCTASASPLFAVTGAVSLPKPVSPDSWRKTLGAFFSDAQVSSHSLRRGGASWYVHEAQVDESVVQAQGGWASAEVMRTFYSQSSPELIKQRLIGTVGRLRRCAVEDSPLPSRKRSRSPSPAASWDAAPWCTPAPASPLGQ